MKDSHYFIILMNIPGDLQHEVIVFDHHFSKGHWIDDDWGDAGYSLPTPEVAGAPKCNAASKAGLENSTRHSTASGYYSDPAGGLLELHHHDLHTL